MATQTMRPSRKDSANGGVFNWKGVDRKGQTMQGQLRAASAIAAREALRKQGIRPTAVSEQTFALGQSIKPKEIALFTRQLSTMMKSGIPLLQSFDIVGQGSTNPSLGRMVQTIRRDIETGTSLNAAFRKHPKQFDELYCNLLTAGESAGILDTLLDRLAVYMEKTEAVKAKIKSALTYPIAVMGVAGIVVTVIMLFVVPAFKQVFSSFGSELPGPTLMVIAISEFFVNYWYLVFGSLIGGWIFISRAIAASRSLQTKRDGLLLRIPVFGNLIRKACVARWTRTLATMFAAGVPLVEALQSVGGASGNIKYIDATVAIRQQVSSGISLTAAMTQSGMFPSMVLQMCAIGEESGSLDYMLGKSADFFESEVDEAVAGISSLMEPFIIVFLGTIIGGLVVALYLPIFKMGQVV
jgi:type IV pilus assembly protein PilC